MKLNNNTLRSAKTHKLISILAVIARNTHAIRECKHRAFLWQKHVLFQ